MGSILYNFYIKDLEKKIRRKDIEQYISTRMSRNVKKTEPRKLHRGSRDGEGQGMHESSREVQTRKSIQ